MPQPLNGPPTVPNIPQSEGAEITIRRLRPSDSIAELTDLLHRAYAKQVALGLHALASRQTPEITRKRVARGECFVAEMAGRLVGTIMFQEPSWGGGGGAPESGPRWFRRPDVSNFSQFAVEPSLQGRGLGLRLLDTVEQRATELGMAELALSTAEPDTALVEFYRRRGFRDVERFDWGVTNYTSLIMSKALRTPHPPGPDPDPGAGV
jgi:GNAT superfamily N-acetyltransferase